jgi:hypothetical protein
MEGWDVALLVVAGYVAVTALVRLMIGHRNRLVAELRRQMRSGRKQRQVQEGNSRQAEPKKKAA